MADPLTIMGATAASFQFASYAFKGILKATQLTDDIHDVSQRTSQYLGHINREVALVNTLLRPDSPIFDQLSTTQYARISKPAIEARRLMEEIQQDLRPLLDDGQGMSNPRKRWENIVRIWKSLKNKQNLENKFKCLDRLSDSLLRELEVSGFETQSLLRDQGSQILTTIAASAADMLDTRQLVQKNNALESQILNITQSRAVCMTQSIDSLRQDMVQSQASTGQSIVEVKDSLDTLSQEIRDNAMLSSSHFHTELSNHEAKIFSRLQAIEDLVSLIPDIRNELRMALMVSTRQSHSDRNPPLDIGNSAFEIDLRGGTARLETSRHIVEPSLEPVSHTGFRERPNVWRCLCRAGTSTTLWNCGKLGFRSETQTVNSCPVHGKARRWSFSIEAKLSPLLKGTLELTIGLISGRKGWEMTPSMKFKSIVKRSESPIFQLFDRFVETWTTPLSEDEYYAMKSRDDSKAAMMKWNTQLKEYQWFTCEERSIKESLVGIIRGVEESIVSGQASGTDVDENGSTLLIETFLLVGSCVVLTQNAGGEINRLVRMANILGVDPTATIEKKIPKHLPLLTEGSTYHSFSAIHVLHLEFLSTKLAGVSFYDSLLEYDGLMESLKNFQWRRSHLADARRLILTHPSSAEHLTIIQRSLPALKSLYTHYTFKHEISSVSVSPMELAVGWRDGLRFLVDRGCPIETAFALASDLEDQESASILLSTNRPISAMRVIESTLNCKPIFQLVAQELWRRKEALKTLVLDHVNQEEQDKIGLCKSWISEENTEEIYHLLERKTRIPEKLTNAMEVRLHCEHAFSGYTLEHHKIAYAAGFVNVDLPCVCDETPLAEVCERYFRVSREDLAHDQWCDEVVWFLERGASPKFPLENRLGRRWPHLLFYLGAMIKANFNGFDKRLTNACGYEFVTDQCECFCSRGGCIPPFMFWRCCDDHDTCLSSQCKYRFDRRFANLRHWTRSWNFSRVEKEDCYREMCQLELFERLGMVHTCCYGSKNNILDAKEIRLEDESSARQLKQLLRLYKSTRKLLFDFPVEEFWTIWWMIVDGILPPLSEEACRGIPRSNEEEYVQASKEHRATRMNLREGEWAGMLNAAGYGDLDFGDVIKCHFAKYLILCKTTIERRDRWKSHRLVGNPRPLGLKRRLYNVYV